MKKDRREREDKGRPDDDAKRTRSFGHVKQRSEERGESNNVNNDRNDDRGSRPDEMVDKVVLCRDEGASEVEQIEVCQTEGNRSRMGERSHNLLSFIVR